MHIFYGSSKSSFRSIERVAASEGCGSILDLTSSPCESTSFAEMGAALRERDYELSYLRQTMEHNEQVIFKVYQEKEHAYERELRKLKTLHESRLRAAAQKSLKLEQMLMIQTYQVKGISEFIKKFTELLTLLIFTSFCVVTRRKGTLKRRKCRSSR